MSPMMGGEILFIIELVKYGYELMNQTVRCIAYCSHITIELQHTTDISKVKG